MEAGCHILPEGNLTVKAGEEERQEEDGGGVKRMGEKRLCSFSPKDFLMSPCAN